MFVTGSIRQHIKLSGFAFILSNAASLAIQISQHEAGTGVSLLSGFNQPLHPVGNIPFNERTINQHPPQTALGIHITGARGLQQFTRIGIT